MPRRWSACSSPGSGGASASTLGNTSKNFSGTTHFDFLIATRCGLLRWKLRPITALHLPIKFRKRIHHDLLGHVPHELVVFRTVVLKHARDDVTSIGRGPEYLGDASRHITIPVRANQKVEPRRRAVHFAQIGKATVRRSTIW